MQIMAWVCKFWLIKITSFKIKRELMYVLNNFLNKLIFKKLKSFIALKTLGNPINFNKTPECLSNSYFLLTDCLGIQFLIHFPISA